MSAFLASALDVLANSPSVPLLVNYFGIYIGIVPAAFFLATHLRHIEIRAIDLLVLAVLTALVPVAFQLSQLPLNIFGNYLRFLYPIIAVWFWSASRVPADELVAALYPALWKATLAAVVLYIAFTATGVANRPAQHFPELLFLFAVTLRERRYLHLFAIVVLSVISAKESLYVALVAMIAANAFLRRQWAAVFVLTAFVLVIQIWNFNPIFYVLYELGGNFARAADVMTDALYYGVNERELDAVVSNRVSEYISIWQDWMDHGVPWLGRGLGGTVMVTLGYAGIAVERSTLHNSFLVAFHTLGLGGAYFLWRYYLSTAVRIANVSPTLFVAQVGILAYALFSNTLMTKPAMVLIAAASWHLVRGRAGIRLLRHGLRSPWPTVPVDSNELRGLNASARPNGR